MSTSPSLAIRALNGTDPDSILPLASAWRYRELLRLVVVRNLKVRYQRSVLGFLWALLNPLATILILVFVFGYIVRIPVDNYWAFLASGYFAWVFIQHTLATSATIIDDHAHMIRGAGFPTEVLVFGQAVARGIEFLVELALATLLLVIFRHGAVPPSLLMLPLVIAIHFILTIGLALPIAVAAVFFHDVRHALPVGLMLVGYLSPVYYPAELVPDALQRIYMLNPIATLLSLYHSILYYGRWPAPGMVAGALLLSLIFLFAGHVVFQRYRRLFAEIV